MPDFAASCSSSLASSLMHCFAWPSSQSLKDLQLRFTYFFTAIVVSTSFRPTACSQLRKPPPLSTSSHSTLEARSRSSSALSRCWFSAMTLSASCCASSTSAPESLPFFLKNFMDW